MHKQNTNAFVDVDWPVVGVKAFSTTRQSPIPVVEENPVYGDFNLALHVGDDSAIVEQNRQTLLELLPEHTQIQWLDQVHGAEVHTVERHSVSTSVLQGDALVTRDKHIALAIMTADCLPILLANKNGHEVAAIHGGWKPLAKGIIKNTLDLMQTGHQDIVAWLGPAIGPTTFEVGEDVYQAFVTQSPSHQSAFTKTTQDKYLANLPLIATQQLAEHGVSLVKHFDACTVSQPQRFYSYRKDKVTGRMATLIVRS